MRQHVCIPSGCQQWATRTLAVGKDRFAYMSTLAIYVYSMDLRPIAILARHEKHLSAICFSPHTPNLLACAVSSQEVKVYDVDTQSEVHTLSFSGKHSVVQMRWHRSLPSTVILALSSQLVAWDYGLNRWETIKDVKSQVIAFDQSVSDPSLVAVATKEGHVVVLNLTSKRVVKDIDLNQELPSGPAPGPACDLRWEPLAQAYLLVACKSGTMLLYDAASGELMSTFAKQPAALRCLDFLQHQPGNFLAASNRSGALQLWNVSQAQPLRSFKTGGGMVQGICSFPASHAHAHSQTSNQAGASASAAGAGGGRASGSGPSTRVLISFTDGNVMLYDLDRQQAVWRQEGSHTETIFDCRFSSTDPNLLATASFDSTVRVWDVRTSSCVKLLTGAEGILYCVSWSCDGRLLATSNNVGTIFIYDYARGCVIKTFPHHTKQSLKVVFHPTRPTLLASASMDGTVMVFQMDGEIKRTMRHPGGVSCLAWAPLCPDMLVTTCETGDLYLWDTSKPAAECLMGLLKGHLSRTFNVEFSPMVPGLLISTSNDKTARVWNTDTKSCQVVLEGHEAEVRAVAWHPEVPYIAFTGSWDATIRVWDVRSGRCLRVAADHHADVYGLSCHPLRPFLLASSSRDTTIRLWSTLELTPHLLPLAVVRHVHSLRSESPSQVMKASPATPALMAGPGSHLLAERTLALFKGVAANGGAGSGASAPSASSISAAFAALPFPVGPITPVGGKGGGSTEGAGAAAPGAGGGASGAAVLQHAAPPSLERLQAVFDFFLPPGGVQVLWELARMARAGEAGGGGASRRASSAGASASSSLLYTATSLPSGQDSVQHWSVAKQAATSSANLLELSATSKGRGPGSAGGARREDVLREAAVQHLVAGNAERCCELLAEVGDWDRALALAPAVSGELWARLMRARATALLQAKAPPSDLLPIYLATGQTVELHNMLSDAQQHELAFTVAAIAAIGGYPSAAYSGLPPPPPPPPMPPPSGPPLPHPPSSPPAGASAPSSHLSSPLSFNRRGSETQSALGLAAPDSPTSGGDKGNLPPLQPPPSMRGATLPALARNPSVSLVASGLSASAAAAAAAAAAGAGGALSTSAGAPSTSGSSTTPGAGGADRAMMTSPLPVQRMPSLKPVLSALPPTPTAPGSSAPSPPLLSPTEAPSSHTSSAELPLAHADGTIRVLSTASASMMSPAPPPPSALTLTSPNGAQPSGSGRSGPPIARSGSSVRQRTASITSAPPGLALASPGGSTSRGGDAYERAVASRSKQARVYYMQGQPVHAACCALSVDDVESAVGLLLRGHAPELAAGLAIALRAGSALRTLALTALAQRCEAAGDLLTAAELLRHVPAPQEQCAMLAVRYRGQQERDSPYMYSLLGLQDPSKYGPLADKAIAAIAAQRQAQGQGQAQGAGQGLEQLEGVRHMLLAGRHEAAADALLAIVWRLLEGGARPPATPPTNSSSPEDPSPSPSSSSPAGPSPTPAQWDLLRAGLNSLWPPALPKATWDKVFATACYLGGNAALAAGYLPVGAYLMVMSGQWGAQRGLALPVPADRLVAEIGEVLDVMSGPGLRGLLAALTDTAKAATGLQVMLRARYGRGGAGPGGAVDGPDFGSPPSLTTPHAPAPPQHSPNSLLPSLSGRLRGLGSGATGALGPVPTKLQGLDASAVSLRSGGGPAGAAASSSGSVSVSAGAGAGAGAAGGRTPSPQPVGASAAVGSGGTAGAAPGGGSGPGPAWGAVVACAAYVPCRPLRGGLPRSTITGEPIQGAAVQLDAGEGSGQGVFVSLSEAVMLSRVMRYSPLGNGKLLVVP